MLVPLSWLKDYVDIDITPEELEKRLFDSGFEVEELTEVGKDISNVVAGLVTECEPIPDTHLHVCKVDCGDKGEFQICCGASNVEEGGVYPVALVGASVLMTGKDHKTVEGVMTIKKGKLRGIDSEGMLCSGTELGVSEGMYPGAGFDGLLCLPKEMPLGTDVKELLGLNDWIFDISITANRPDCQSIYGIAREVAAALKKPLKTPALDFTETDVKKEGFSVKVDAPDICPRYIGHYVYDVEIKESPLWMKRRLSLVGQEPISNIVDITNYVLLEIGQPMHAFDCDFIKGNIINVRRAKDGEPIVTLDSQEYKLDSNNLVICDGEKPVALAGVMGGLNSEIRDTTKEVLFESAKFARDNIRKTARQHGKATDASARYSKGVDEYSTVMAMKRALHLIEELECGKVSSTHVDVNTGNSIEKKPMTVSIKRVNDVLGIDVPVDVIIDIMKNLDFDPLVNEDELKLMIPAYREDMESYPDVAEEIIRLYGYDHVIPTFLPDSSVTMGGLNNDQKKELKLKKALCETGAYECIHYSFFSSNDFDMINLPEDSELRNAIRIMNPINEDLSVMRTTLVPSMLAAVGRNHKKGNLEGRLFEIANTFIPKSLPLNDYPAENRHLCGCAFGSNEDFFSLKGLTQKVADTYNVTFDYEKAEYSFLHPYQTAVIKCGNEEIGFIGKVSYEVAEKYDFRTECFIFEIDLSLLDKYTSITPKFVPLSKYPDEVRDLALVMDKEITCGQVEKVISDSCKAVKNIALFDVYEGSQIPEDKKSMAFKITFIAPEEGFEEDAVDKYIKKILKNLKFHLDTDLRS